MVCVSRKERTTVSRRKRCTRQSDDAGHAEDAHASRVFNRQSALLWCLSELDRLAGDVSGIQRQLRRSLAASNCERQSKCDLVQGCVWLPETMNAIQCLCEAASGCQWLREALRGRQGTSSPVAVEKSLDGGAPAGAGRPPPLDAQRTPPAP
ncbi:hypothetical protein NDU88_002781 [Pleurodeles waltl]|uniref:Uncharacterized protein n=1 Tax=Pleurodeles waltl TaxID=8319 RepID=A0AAV7KT51_PLEWA|nr:hypothetical protein NDU88_002781 [Pleurodeles waltl]